MMYYSIQLALMPNFIRIKLVYMLILKLLSRPLKVTKIFLLLTSSEFDTDTCISILILNMHVNNLALCIHNVKGGLKLHDSSFNFAN